MSELDSTENSPANSVRGERDATPVNRASSVQSRISSVLAIGLMSFLGLAMLTWYYSNAMTRQSRARQSAQTASTNHAQGDAPLPSLGRIDPPPPLLDTAPMPSPDPVSLREIPLDVSPATGANGAPQPKTAEQLALERQLPRTCLRRHRPARRNPVNWAPCCGPRSARRSAHKCCRRNACCWPRARSSTVRWKPPSTRRCRA